MRCSYLARSLALPGAAFTFLALVTGSLWGRPAWGTWWQWDGRMTSVLVLLFIYIAYMAIWNISADRRQASRLWFTLRGTEAELIALKQQRAKQTRPATVTLEDVSS